MNKFGRLTLGKTMFLQIDIQQRFQSLSYNYPNIVGVASMMMRASKSLGIPIIATEQNPKAMLSTDPAITKFYHNDVKRFTKSMFSAYQDANIKEEIKKIAPSSIILYGLESHVCVLQTALDLLENKYDVHVLVDGISSMKKYDRSCAMLKMARAGLNLSTSESVLFELVRDGKSPLMKHILPLVKERCQEKSPILPISWD